MSQGKCWTRSLFPLISQIYPMEGPNNSGDFHFMIPTIEAKNMNLYTGTDSYTDPLIPELFFYPNPAQNELNIRIADHIEHTVRIFNMTGQLCGTWQLKESLSVDISHLSAGFYLITSDDLTPCKFIKK